MTRIEQWEAYNLGIAKLLMCPGTFHALVAEAERCVADAASSPRNHEAQAKLSGDLEDFFRCANEVIAHAEGHAQAVRHWIEMTQYHPPKGQRQ